jgi:hypothetical protein
VQACSNYVWAYQNSFPDHKALHKLPSIVVITNGWSFTFTPVYVFVVWFSSTLTTLPLTNRLTVQEITVVHLLRERNFLLWKPKVCCRTHKTSPSVSVRRQINTVHTLLLYLFKAHIDSIIPSTPCSSKWSFPFRFPTGILCVFDRSCGACWHTPPSYFSFVWPCQ